MSSLHQSTVPGPTEPTLPAQDLTSSWIPLTCSDSHYWLKDTTPHVLSTLAFNSLKRALHLNSCYLYGMKVSCMARWSPKKVPWSPLGAPLAAPSRPQDTQAATEASTQPPKSRQSSPRSPQEAEMWQNRWTVAHFYKSILEIDNSYTFLNLENYKFSTLQAFLLIFLRVKKRTTLW